MAKSSFSRTNVEDLIALWDKKKEKDKDSIKSTEFTTNPLGQDLIRSLYFSHRAINGNSNFTLDTNDGWNSVIASSASPQKADSTQIIKEIQTNFGLITKYALPENADRKLQIQVWNANFNEVGSFMRDPLTNPKNRGK
jgi:hypothetical protein